MRQALKFRPAEPEFGTPARLDPLVLSNEVESEDVAMGHLVKQRPSNYFIPYMYWFSLILYTFIDFTIFIFDRCYCIRRHLQFTN